MVEKKKLVYILDKSSIYSACFRPQNYKVYESYRFLQRNRFSRFLFRRAYHHAKHKTNFYNPELKDCGDAVIIGFDTVDPELIRWIREGHPNNRIIIYFINTVRDPKRVQMFMEQDCELWSFDRNDCKKYDMQFNDWYCTYVPNQNPKIKYDVVFIGREKTRRPFLNRFAEYMNQNGISYYYHITHERNYPIINPRKYRYHISYAKMIELEKKARAMIEIVEPGQGGSTLRIMDAVFNNIKLITNFASIKQSELYHPNNIYILEDDSFDGVKNFLEKPFQPYSKEIMQKYSFEHWIGRFGIEL